MPSAIEITRNQLQHAFNTISDNLRNLSLEEALFAPQGGYRSILGTVKHAARKARRRKCEQHGQDRRDGSLPEGEPQRFKIEWTRGDLTEGGEIDYAIRGKSTRGDARQRVKEEDDEKGHRDEGEKTFHGRIQRADD